MIRIRKKGKKNEIFNFFNNTFYIKYCLLKWKKNNCESALAKLKPSCNFIGSSVENMKEFSKKNQTIGQTLGIEKKSLREFSEENKTIDQTLKNLGILKK